MPRNYQRKIGSHHYRNYSEDNLLRALDELRRKTISLRKAEEKYNIPIITLRRKLRNENPGKPGKPTVFSQEEEQLLVAHIIALSTYGFPITSFDLRCIVSSYLHSVGRKVPIFKNNTLPGKDWVASFLRRHSELSQRMSRNISENRAAVGIETIKHFFLNLEKTIEGVANDCIWNYDETNLVDDPGNIKVLVKRGTKYPERIRNSTKASTTIMMAGNAAGELAPPYVVYKADHLYTTWMENGPAGTRYNRSKSGWFDSFCFQDWFKNHMFGILMKKPGKKVLIGDNLSSHINYDVIKMCEENNISFVALPPNTTHLLQPLDVALFRSMKGNWRLILEEWKRTPYGRRSGTISKDCFPRLLKNLIDKMCSEKKAKKNLISGFRKCGICPLDKRPVIARLSSNILDALPTYKEKLGQAFVEHLEQQRGECGATKKRKRKFKVPPGMGITIDDLAAEEITDVLSQKNSASQKTKKASTSKGKKKRKPSSDSDEIMADDSINYAESDESPFNFSESDEDDLLPNSMSEENINDQRSKNDFQLVQGNSQVVLEIGNYVAVKYDSHKHHILPGRSQK